MLRSFQCTVPNTTFSSSRHTEETHSLLTPVFHDIIVSKLYDKSFFELLANIISCNMFFLTLYWIKTIFLNTKVYNKEYSIQNPIIKLKLLTQTNFGAFWFCWLEYIMSNRSGNVDALHHLEPVSKMHLVYNDIE